MATSSPIQTAFNGGELGKRLRGRLDSDLYRRSLDYIENFEPLAAGPILLAPGFEYIDESNFEAPIRLIRFRAAGLPDYVLALGHQKMQIFSAAGRNIFGAANLIANGDFSNGATSWTLDDGAYVTNGQLRLQSFRVFDPDLNVWFTEFGTAEQTFVVAAPGDYVFSFDRAGAAVSVWFTWAGGGVNLNGSGPFTVTLPAGNVTIHFQVGGVHPVTATLDNVSILAVSSNYDIVTPWTGVQLDAIQYVSETGKDRMIFVHPNVEPRILQRNADGSWTFGAPGQNGLPAWVNKPASWQNTNWPGVIELHKSRSWWSGVPDDRNKFWASKVGSPFDFSVSNPIVASDAIIYDLATKAAIKWFKGRRVLLCGTDEGENTFLAQNGVISPADIHSDEESEFGSAPVMAVLGGSSVLYVSSDRRKVRAANFDYNVDGWASKDLTYVADHITDGFVNELHFARSRGTVVLRVGTSLVLCTLDESEQVAAWWRRTTTGTILSAAVTDGPTGSAVWIAVQRTNGLFIERMRLVDEVQLALDSMLSTVTGAGGAVTGLDHLEGETVRVVLDGALVEDAVVDAGAINVGADVPENTPVVVGLPYLGRAVTLPKDTRTGKAHSPRIGLLLNDSALPLVNGKRVEPDRTPSTPMDTPEARRSGKVRSANLGSDSEGKVTIEQDLPFRTEIQALYEVTKIDEVM